MRRKTVTLCIDARMSDSSGIGTALRELIPLFQTPPFELILLVKKQSPSWNKQIRQIVINSSIYSIREQWELPRKIPSCDLFWSPHYNIPLLPIRAKKRVVTIHDACHLALSKHLSFLEKVYARFMMQCAYHISDAAVTDSLFSQNELRHYLGEKQESLVVIPMAVNKDFFQKSAQKEVVKRKYGLPDRFLLYVGNLKPHKNLEGLLQAFEKIDTSHHLVLVGKTQGLRHNVQVGGEKVMALTHVPDEDLPALYSLADLFIFPSFYEGFGLPPLEAMSCGCPTAVSNQASIPEACGNASVYFNPHDTDEMARVISHTVQNADQKKMLIEKGYRRIESFSWEQTAEKYMQLFKRIL